MKLLLHANGPHVGTGYGVQCALLAERLKADGYDVAISCTYGHAGSITTWRGITLYPQGWLTNSDDLITGHANHFFGGDPKAGWIILLQDVWSLMNPELGDYQVAAWCPVDHLPAPPDVVEFFRRTGAVPVAMSRFGQTELTRAGLDASFVPLAVDTTAMKPSPTLEPDRRNIPGRELLEIPDDAFVVGMVAMNKGWSRDRKGFNEAIRAFGVFARNHPEAILYLHTDLSGVAEGINLIELLQHSGVNPDQVRHVNQYAYRIGGIGQDMMAVTYTAMDVLLSPSHGEGFCVPLIEAQACGTPVIAADFSAQTELAGSQYGAAGVLLGGQLEWDPTQHSSYLCPYVDEVVEALEGFHKTKASGLMGEVAEHARAFAMKYDADTVYETLWKPFLATLEPAAPPEPKPPMTDIAVIVPAMRKDNLSRLEESFSQTNDGTATLYMVHDTGMFPGSLYKTILTGHEHTTYAQKVNIGVAETSESFVCVVGDDVEFKEGWIQAARTMSDRYDVIGTNDCAIGVKNPDVAAGRHADHFFVRRSYIDDPGASLEGPGILMPEVYNHWWVDREVIGLAKARGVFTPCLASIIEHHHPGFDGREDLRQADPVYMAAVEHADEDAATYRSRLPLIEMQRTGRGKA